MVLLFCFDGKQLSTDGIDIHSITFQWTFEETDEMNKVVKNKRDITLNVWDFAGQEIYYTTHQFFLSERSIYLVVWNLLEGTVFSTCIILLLFIMCTYSMDTEETASRIEFWLQSINARANGAPVIVVGTHSDEVARGTTKLIIKNMREKYV